MVILLLPAGPGKGYDKERPHPNEPELKIEYSIVSR
jgi:hypothetical protein